MRVQDQLAGENSLLQKASEKQLKTPSAISVATGNGVLLLKFESFKRPFQRENERVKAIKT
jgi:hypothetical protein